MNSEQRNQVEMFRNVDKWLEEHADKLANVPDIGETSGELNTNLAKIDELATRTVETSAGATKEKALARNRLDLATLKLINSLKLFAQRTKDIGLLNEVDFNKSQIETCSSQLLLSRSGLVVNKAKAAQANGDAAKYNVTPEAIAEIEEAIAAFRNVTVIPRQIIATKKEANQRLEELIDDTMDFLRDEIDVQMANLEYDEPDLFNQYKNVRIIIDR